jgi:hypothetical protein
LSGTITSSGNIYFAFVHEPRESLKKEDEGKIDKDSKYREYRPTTTGTAMLNGLVSPNVDRVLDSAS